MIKQTNPRLVNRLKTVSRTFGLVVFLTGFIALCGWQFDLEYFKKVFPGLPVIAPNTAFLFFLIGLMLFFASLLESKKGFRYGGLFLIFSGAVSIFGALTLFEYFSGISLGIDGILFSSKQAGAAVRMSPQSAFNFVMVGLALFFMFRHETKKNVSRGQLVILLMGAVSLYSFVGFIYNIPSFYTIAPYKGMAAHTAVAFVMVFFSILTLNSGQGFMKIFVGRGISGIASRRLFFTLIFIISAEMLIAGGRKAGFFGFALESFLHLFLVAGVFVYLIFFAFRSLDRLGKMEYSLARTKELDRAKTEFVSLASHQLRTPLTAVSWYTEMLLGKDVGEMNEKQESYLREIYAGNQRMIDLVDDLLNSSRIDMGTLEIKPKSIDLREISETILDEFLPQINQKHLIVERKYSRNVPSLELDPELVGIVFQNIVSNAVKYTPQNGKITVEIKRQNSHVQVKISDNGWGIPILQQKKIFTKLFRADNVRAMDTEGTGLGLYIARAIVRQSGGKIWFESKEKKGTSFYINFKLKK